MGQYEVGVLAEPPHDHIVSAAIQIVRAVKGLVQVPDQVLDELQGLETLWKKSSLVREDRGERLDARDKAVDGTSFGTVTGRDVVDEGKLDVHEVPGLCLRRSPFDQIRPDGPILERMDSWIDFDREQIGDGGFRDRRKTLLGNKSDDAVAFFTPSDGCRRVTETHTRMR